MQEFLGALKDARVTLAFAVLIGGLLIVRFAAPPAPVLLGCSAAVVLTAGLKALRAGAGKR